MKKSNRIKYWRLNVVINYYDQQLANTYRPDLLELLKHLASIYKLDYAISENHPFPALFDLNEQKGYKSIADLVYFRSNKNSRVDQKKMRSIIVCMFDKVPSWFCEGVDVFYQQYKTLPEYPFPHDFYRPLNYPYIEFHKGSQKALYIYADEVMKMIEEEQDFSLN